MAFWSKKDSDDEIRISKEEYEDLKTKKARTK